LIAHKSDRGENGARELPHRNSIISSVRVSKPLATNSHPKKAKKYITASVEDCPYFKKIRNKLKFGANKAVLETGKVSAESNCSLCSRILLVNEFQNKAKNPAPKEV
jgi:hypothetical protein